MEQPRIEAVEFARLAEELFAAETTTETAEQVVALATHELDIDHAGISMLRSGGRLETLAPTDSVASTADELQQELREGPLLDTSWSGQTLYSQHLEIDARWPQWGPKAAGLGISSVLAVELLSASRRIGALNLFSREVRQFTRDDIAFAHIFARHAALALNTAEHDANMEVALDGRKLIGQAQGILMERYGIEEARAFEILKRYSQDNNVKLREVAAGLVATRRLPEAT